MHTGRIDHRVYIGRTAFLRSERDPTDFANAFVENLSAHGARLLTRRPYVRDAKVLLTESPAGQAIEGRVIYCEPLGRDAFALGLSFIEAVPEELYGRR